MKQHPILFSTAMVLALLAGTKTQTRRIIKPQPIDNEQVDGHFYAGNHSDCVKKDMFHDWQHQFAYQCAKWQPGDVLWVRETWRQYFWNDGNGNVDYSKPIVDYRADNPEPVYLMDGDGSIETDKHGAERFVPWKPSLFMPRGACRLFLEIKSIRVERLHDISEADARAEGYTYADLHRRHEQAAGMGLMKMPDDPQLWFAELWREINGKDSYDANPWVWVIEFEKIDKPQPAP